MNSILNSSDVSPTTSVDATLKMMSDQLAELTPQLKQAAEYILENPGVVGVCSLREIASAAQVKPNTLVRLARYLGFSGFDDLRIPFKEQIVGNSDSFPDRARQLQDWSRDGALDSVFSSMASAALANIEQLFSTVRPADLDKAADMILGARYTSVLGVGVARVFAQNFAYLAGMAFDNIQAIPQDGELAVDALLRADSRDLLVAITFKPYRRDVVETVNLARQNKVPIIAISNTPAAPIMQNAAVRFVVPTESPQFFTSAVAFSALLETLVAYLVAGSDKKAISSIEKFHQIRRRHGIYWDEALLDGEDP